MIMIMIMRMRKKMTTSMILSSTVTEFIRTVYYYFFYQDILHKENTQALFKYLNTLKKHNKEHKQLSFRCKAMNFC